MATPTLILGANNWAIEEDNILGYALGSSSKQYLPREISFTRGSDATYTDSTGIIRQACWNLLQYSEEFDNAIWSKQRTTVSSNAIISPSKTLTGDKLVETNVNGTHIVFTNLSQPSTSPRNQVFSFYAKSGERNWIATSGDMGTTYFNLNTGQVGTVTTSTFWFSGITASMENIGDGWYRCVLSGFGFFEFNVGLKLATADGVDTYTGDGTSGAFIWGAQLVQGSQPLTYLRTTDRLNFPRVDSSTGTKAFLLEPQRTNLLTYSQAFNDATWAKIASTGGSITATDNYNASPDGNTNASRLLITNLNSAYVAKSFTSVNGSSYTISIWAKSNTASSYTFQLRDGYSGVVSSNLTVTPTWQRFTLTFTASGTTAELQFRTLVVGSYDLSIYGAQAELGAYQTTYIQTQATTVTRIADSAVKTGISSLIGQSEGALFVEFNSSFLESYTQRILTLSDGTNTNVIGFQLSSANQLIFYVESGGVNQVAITKSSPSITLGSTVKIAAAYANNDFVFYVNGTQVGTDTVGSVPATSQLRFSEGNGTSFYYGQIKQVVLYTSRVSNSELAALTTL